jgi:hypothetical protein
MNRLLLLLGALTFGTVYSQTDQTAIREWQGKHPDYVIISSSNYGRLTKHQQDLLGAKVVIYDTELTAEALNAYAPEEKAASVNAMLYTNKEAELIKRWLGENPDVKIVPRSHFDAGSDEDRQIYLQNDCMILLGETITAQDIQLFH